MGRGRRGSTWMLALAPWLALTPGLAAGCGRIGYDPADRDASDGPGRDAGPAADFPDAAPGLIACVDVDLGSMLGEIQLPPPEGNDESGSCDESSADAVYLWRPPASGYFDLRVCSALMFGLTLREGSCAASALGCSVATGCITRGGGPFQPGDLVFLVVEMEIPAQVTVTISAN